MSSFYTCAPKIMIRWCMVLEIWCATDGWTETDGQRRMDREGWTDRLTDGWKKWHIEVGAPPKKCMEISSFCTSVPKIMTICYIIPEIWHVTVVNVIFVIYLIFVIIALFNPLYQKLWSHAIQFLRYGVWWMDGQTYRWTNRKIDI